MYADKYLEEKCGGSFKKLAMSWAPINYQYISLENNPYETKKDLLCAVNFGCYGLNKDEIVVDETRSWNTKIVRDRLREIDFEKLVPAAYYSVAVTKNHYFILYAFYHADDNDHPNDLEGCLVILERDDKRPYLLGMITVAHYDFVPFIYDSDKIEPTDHPLWQYGFRMEAEEELEGDHVLIQQEEGKHGMYALGNDIGPLARLKRRLCEIVGKPEDVIVYYPGETANRYSKDRLYRGKGNPHTPAFYYELIDILDTNDGLYDRYLEAQRLGENLTFTKDGAFHSMNSLHANGPWLWEPAELVNTIQKGAMWNDPATLVKQFFKPKGKEFSTTYQKKMMEKQ